MTAHEKIEAAKDATRRIDEHIQQAADCLAFQANAFGVLKDPAHAREQLKLAIGMLETAALEISVTEWPSKADYKRAGA